MVSQSIPADIWINVAQFIPEKDLGHMLSINQTFFHLAMDVRYKNAYFLRFDDAALDDMRRLRDTAIAHRVRSLYVTPWYGKEIVDRYQAHDKTHRFDFNASIEEVTQTMVDTVTCFSNVTELSIQWTGIPSEEDLRPFLVAAWNTFRSTLRKLSLLAPRNDFPALLLSAGSFTALQQLDIQFNGDSRDGPGGTDTMTSSLANFINEAASALRSLSISCQLAMDVDLASLFTSLGYIPNLERLKIVANFDMCGLPYPLGLTRILHEHASTMRHFEWTMAFGGLGTVGARSRRVFVDWLEKNKSQKSILSNLLTLQIVVPPSGMNLAVEYIQRSADTLTSLMLKDEGLENHEVDTVLSLFSHRPVKGHLRELNLRVIFISPELILLLAHKLPCLKKLTIIASNVRGSSQNNTRLMEGKDVELENAREFAVNMRKQDIRDWPLYDIEIFTFFCVDKSMSMKLMAVLSECVPSIQLFAGKDKQETEKEIDEHL